MNKREKLLAAAVGLVALIAMLKYASDKVRSAYRLRDREIVKLEKQIREKQYAVVVGDAAAEEKASFEQRALPPEPEMASSLYRAWLLELVNQAGFSENKVTSLPGRPFGDVYTRFTFMVTGRTTLDRLTEFLYRFYSVDHLHRINMLVAKPVPETKQLDLTISIEALSLPNSVNRTALATRPARRLELSNLSDYQDAIVGRNFTSPPNKPPRLAVDAKSSYFLDESVTFTVKAEDPEGDAVRYELGDDAPAGAQIDARSGRVSFRPEKTGPYEFSVAALDNGLPNQMDARTVRFQVSERPPAPARQEAAPPPSFNAAQYAFLTGITEVGGKPQLWIFIRTEGRMLKLSEGDGFEIGLMKGVIKRIDPRQVELEAADGARLTVDLGHNLQEARPVQSGA